MENEKQELINTDSNSATVVGYKENGGHRKEFFIIQQCIKSTVNGNNVTNDLGMIIRKILADNENEALGYFIKATSTELCGYNRTKPVCINIENVGTLDSHFSL